MIPTPAATKTPTYNIVSPQHIASLMVRRVFPDAAGLARRGFRELILPHEQMRLIQFGDAGRNAGSNRDVVAVKPK
jgi:hypothetical protein